MNICSKWKMELFKRLTKIRIFNDCTTANPHLQSSVGHNLWYFVIDWYDVYKQIVRNAFFISCYCNKSYEVRGILTAIMNVLDLSRFQLLMCESVDFRFGGHYITECWLLNDFIFQNFVQIVLREWTHYIRFQSEHLT